jgi:hypothetical protein
MILNYIKPLFLLKYTEKDAIRGKIRVAKEAHQFGCVMQFFGFIQRKVLVDNMLMNKCSTF